MVEIYGKTSKKCFIFVFSIDWICFSTSNKRNSTHQKLDEKTEIFTFTDIGRKEDPTKKNLSI